VIAAREEATRKTLHLALSLAAAGVLYLLPPLEAATVLAAATAVALAVEVARRASGGFGRAFVRGLGPLLRDREAGRLTGATTLAIGYVAAATLFPGGPAVAAVLVAGVGDAAAAVVGKRWGRLRYPGGKSVEGSLVFFLVVLAIGRVLLPDAGIAPLLALAAVLTLVEAPALTVDDNLYLPPAAAAGFHAAAVLSGAAFFS
jgi:dolichol kinase